jgi:hypothetical protein
MTLVVALFVLLISPSAHAAPKCDWDLIIEGDAVSFKLAPKEKQRYIMAGKSTGGLRKVAKAMWEGPESDNFLMIRLLTELKMADVLMTRSALRWLCRQDDLEKYIEWVELDQTVSIGGDAKKDYVLPPFLRPQQKDTAK